MNSRKRWWGRPPLPGEAAFLEYYFGDSLPIESLRLARSVHPRRSWSPYGARISLQSACFQGNDAGRPVDLGRPRVAATLAHEALHVWQRVQGKQVTWQGACLQIPYALLGVNPYHYVPAQDPERLLQTFLSGNIEQQGQIFEDYVRTHREGGDVKAFSEVAFHVRHGGATRLAGALSAPLL